MSDIGEIELEKKKIMKNGMQKYKGKLNFYDCLIIWLLMLMDHN